MTEKLTIRVWDIPVRIVHWGLVIACIIAYMTADEFETWHVHSGYVVLGLVIFRIMWGFAGNKYSRFGNFIYFPQTAFQYIKGLLKGNAKRYVGHNPAGGWMAIALLVSLLAACLTGLKTYGEQGKGPLAEGYISIVSNAFANDHEHESDHEYKEEHEEHKKDKHLRKREKERDEEHDYEFKKGIKKQKSSKFWEEAHEGVVHFTLLLIFIHIIGALLSSRVHNENLIKGMITGKKEVNQENI
jgi:cytochrome b